MIQSFTFVNELCKIRTFGRHVEKAELVFRNGVLPKIIGKCFTRVPKVTVYDNNDGSQCKGEVIGEMSPCSLAEGQFKYFHLECLNLARALGVGSVLIVET